MNRGGQITLEGLAREASLAREDAREARNHALEVHQSVGAVARELGTLRKLVVESRRAIEGKVDACIDDIRGLRAEILSMRPKLDSLSEIEPELTEEADHIRAARARKKALGKWGRRALVAFVVGAATVAGAAGMSTLLKECHAVVPKESLP